MILCQITYSPEHFKYSRFAANAGFVWLNPVLDVDARCNSGTLVLLIRRSIKG